ncbi:MAG TPA: L-seryl-tRNA(Sec) selenium transferase [Thermoanaerobaculia bacterium]|nr:L-seryl-tRNA(Sec) selenium transferase [Thermoanaerobaculia bacterium]
MMEENKEGEVEHRQARDACPYYRRVVNGTGVILHTGLGRAPLPKEAVEAITASAGHPQRVEIDLATGERGGRDRGCARLLEELLGCEAATVVNNNAAATLLILAALARGRSVIVSRGELVEIGGSFRIPDVLREGGVELREVGTTNRTHLRDYREAIDEQTAMLLKVHTSNYRVVGSTSEVEIEALIELGREHGLPVVHDLGSGCLIDLAARGLPGEQLVSRSIQAGVDLVCFSGDKLLGGPQAGIIAGSRKAVELCRRHPLFRAVRPGRLIYAALEATLRIYRDGEARALREIPAVRSLLAREEELRERAEDLAGRLQALEGLDVTALPCESQAGSGSLPTREYPSWGVSLVPRAGSADRLAELLRDGEPAILARVWEAAVLLDVRTLEDDEIPWIAQRLEEIAGGDGAWPRGAGTRPVVARGGCS